MFSKIVNYFIPASARQDTESLRSARIMVIVFLVTGLLNILYVNNATAVQYRFVHYILLVNGIVCFVTAFLLRQGVPRLLCANIYQLNGWAGTVSTIWFAGGLHSTSTAGLLLTPMTSMLIAGKRSATIWLYVCILSLGFIYWYQITVGPLPELFDRSQRDQLMLFNMIGIMIALFVITLIFQVERERAINNLIAKNEELKTAQQQLIQTEKLAAMGELTAGVAHEIRNPLNFVNNFAELSKDLVEDLKTGVQTGQTTQALTLANLLSDNLGKIAHHGQRATSIVRSMLLHSRADVGEKRATDLNALAQEYLNLAYHGLRAKDKNFNARLTTRLDPAVGLVNCVPQELGRVLLNLYNNAFYAVQQKQRAGDTSYQPEVIVATRRFDRMIEVLVRDNGSGIAAGVRDKIFQPFFTTKPTGQGTGLGLSISYDIVTKGHGGELAVESVAGEFTQFTVCLPTNSLKT